MELELRNSGSVYLRISTREANAGWQPDSSTSPNLNLDALHVDLDTFLNVSIGLNSQVQ